ncbi:redoxin family protein [bacterium]|nr:redoxin family protein [bacterium]
MQLEPKDFDVSCVYENKNLVILFSPTDCGICLKMLSTLNEVYVKRVNQVPIIGIMDTPYLAAALKIQKQFKLQFPMVLDTTGTLKRQFGKRSKPTLMLLDHGSVTTHGTVGDPEDLPRVRKLLGDLTGNQRS